MSEQVLPPASWNCNYRTGLPLSGSCETPASIGAASQEDLSTHNSDPTAHAELFAASNVIVGDLRRFHDAAIAALTGSGRLSVLGFGDSLITRSTDQIWTELLSRYQYNGGFLNSSNYGGGVQIGVTSSGAVYETDGQNGHGTDFAATPTGVVWVVPNGEWARSTNKLASDKFSVYYRKGPGLGTLLIQTSTNGTDWTTEATIETAGAAETVVWTTTKTFSNQGYYLRCASQSGECRFIGMLGVRTTVGSIALGYLNRGGLSLADAVTCPDAAIIPVLQDIAPDLIFVHTDDAGYLYEAFLPALKRWVDAACPKASVVLIGNGPKTDAQGGDAASVVQCAVLRAAAISYGWSFVDSMKILRSYAELVNLGWQGDGLHLDAKAYSFVQSVMWRSFAISHLQARVQTGDIRAFGATNNHLIRRMNFVRDPVFGTAGSFGCDSSGNDLDVTLRSTRKFRVLASDEVTERWVFADTVGSFVNQMPTNTRVGSQNGPGVFSGSGSPEGAVSAPPGSFYLRADGGSGTSFYVKESGTGNTGWVAK